MENTPYLYETLLRVLGQHSNWLDLRHRKTLAWMMVGLLCAKTVSLGAWTPFVVSQAQYAQSLVRRFRRWLDNNRITVEPLYGPLIEQAVVGWAGTRMYVALDTSMLWNTSCLIRLSVISRGRAVPLVWRVIEHGSAAVSVETYQDLSLQRHLIALLNFAPVESRFGSCKRRGKATFDIPINPCARSACSRSVAVGINGNRKCSWVIRLKAILSVCRC